MLLDSIFAPRCAACDRPLAETSALCPPCSESLWPIDAACPTCSLPVEGPTSTQCRKCRVGKTPIDQAFASFRFGGELAVAIRRLKFGGRADLARQLSPLYAADLQRAATNCDVLIPVPLHWRREARRGFNQARTLLRFGAGRRSRRKLDSHTLRRIRATREQSGLRSAERQQNVAGAFSVSKRRARRIRGKSVLLFDDVITTGATLRAAARTLKQAGAKSVVGFALARAA